MSLKKKFFSVAVAAGLIFGGAAVSNATNGYYMIATGAKSLGMAGAVVANPQDASTILQNPAGIAFLKNTTFDIGAAAFMPPRKLNGHKSDSNLFMIPAAGFAYNPLGCNCGTPHFVFGLGMYGVSGMGVDWKNNKLTSGMLRKAYSMMQMMEVSVGGAYRVNDQLAIGFAPAFVYQALSLEMDFDTTGMPAGTPNPYKASLDTANAYGVGFDLGLVYKLNDKIMVGLVYKSKRWMQKLEWNTMPDGMMINSDKVKMRLDMPQQIAFGINFRPIEPLRLEADVRWINYHNVMNEVSVSGMNKPTTTGAMVPMDNWPFHWHNQWVFALGAEYQATKSLTLRAGFNYAKSPIKDDDLYMNIIAPAIVQTHATVGATIGLGDHMELSLAYAHAFEHKQTGKVAPAYQGFYGKTVSVKMHQDTIAAQLTYMF
ncbi:OmpP1/FadL family transporter [Hippea jasoniae]|uniref:OmpP1/FadL family transporter n=1 Tax=Hippea jasoniae TaxID=944479 RepID=UPI000556A803|nr:outer membrane protein transport protein [Hippea jasoniae]